MRRRQGEPSHTNTYRLKKMSSPLPRKVEHQNKERNTRYFGGLPRWQSPYIHLLHPTYPSSIACPSASQAFPTSQAHDFLLPLLPRKSGTFLPRS